MLDVREFAYKRLDAAKETFQRKRVLAPVGYLLHRDGVDIYEFDWSSKDARRKSMKAFKRNARIQKAVATITINECEFYAFPPWKNEKPVAKTRETPEWLRKAIAKGSGRCISMDIEVPGQPAVSVMVAYSTTESGGVRFEKPEEGPVDFNGPAPPKSREEEGPPN